MNPFSVVRPNETFVEIPVSSDFLAERDWLSCEQGILRVLREAARGHLLEDIAWKAGADNNDWGNKMNNASFSVVIGSVDELDNLCRHAFLE
jgi:hypothetical protein